MSRLVRPAFLTSCLGLAAVVAACGGDSGASSAPTTVPSGVVAVETKEYQFTPSTVTIPAGSVTFSVKNAGTEEHEFEVFQADGTTVIDEIEGLVPGLTKTLTLSLEPGTYQFMCKLNGHDVLGMKGTLTVQ
ncbi:MAG TPA: cupredoxin domain-containing protein [Candidatus Binatia bacterium]|nr:cupredoxin domain-containing protein [Candidatus Binatia bacterium]